MESRRPKPLSFLRLTCSPKSSNATTEKVLEWCFLELLQQLASKFLMPERNKTGRQTSSSFLFFSRRFLNVYPFLEQKGENKNCMYMYVCRQELGRERETVLRGVSCVCVVNTGCGTKDDATSDERPCCRLSWRKREKRSGPSLFSFLQHVA